MLLPAQAPSSNLSDPPFPSLLGKQAAWQALFTEGRPASPIGCRQAQLQGRPSYTPLTFSGVSQGQAANAAIAAFLRSPSTPSSPPPPLLPLSSPSLETDDDPSPPS